MGKYDRRWEQPKPDPWTIHPIWRGIGCILLVVIPIMAYALADILVQSNFQNHWMPLPIEMVRSVDLPVVGLVPHLYANLIAAFLLSLLGFGLLTILYGIVNGMFGPSRYGPLDVPPDYRYRARH